MEQIDAQAADLRYLAQAPVAFTDASPYGQPSPDARSPSAGDNSAPPDAVATGDKRKSVDDGGAAARQTRSKRNRYISIACNECKRRKIKCNGETPCKRCGNLNLACLYAPNCCSNNFKDTDDYRHITSNLARLQDEVNWLNQTVKALQADPARLAPAHIDHGGIPAMSPSPSVPSSAPSRPRPDPTYPKTGSFQGPTTMAYSLDVANNTISNMGYRPLGEGTSQHPHQQQPSGPLSATTPGPMSGGNTRSNQPDPLFEFERDEMLRLCQLYEDEVGAMYPVINIQTVMSHARSLASFMGPLRSQPPLEMLNDDKTLLLKTAMCCALVVDEHGHSDRAVRLFDSMEAVLNRKLIAEVSNVESLVVLAMMAGYRYLSNDEVLGWRVIGQVARLCFELGIHRHQGLMRIKNERDRKDALNSFWTAFVLDRRWAFQTGLPFVIQDGEIDPKLPMPDEHPFLVAMVTYSKLSAKVWKQVTNFEPVLAQELHQEEIERVDQEILQWYETIPEEMKVRNWSVEYRQMTTTPSYNLRRLRIWTYLRLNQIRIWLYTPVLHSATSIMANPAQAQRVVDLARDTIQYLHHINTTTNLYRRIQVFYHQFLMSAISAVFLASVHAPVRFSDVCRHEFYMALDLVSELSAKSWVSQRLWRAIRSLKDVAPRFGLNPEDDAHSTAALGMIGLARGGHLDPSSAANTAAPGAQQPQPHGGVPRPGPAADPTRQPSQSAEPPTALDQNGAMLQTEMSRIFEGYVGLNGVQTMVDADGSDGSVRPGTESEMGNSPMYGPQTGTIYTQFKELL